MNLPPGIDLRLGRNLDLLGLPSLEAQSVDHTITDPPYEAEAHSKGRRVIDAAKGKRGVRSAPIDSYDPITDEERREVAVQIVRVTRRWIVVFCQIEGAPLWRVALEAAGARYIRTGIWFKTDGQPQMTGDRPGVGFEALCICYAGRKLRPWNSGGKTACWNRDVWKQASREGNGPKLLLGQKPIDLMVELVDDFTREGELVLDPYLGTGTTAVACRIRGRRCIGFEEKSEQYRMAVARAMGNEVNPRDSRQINLALG